MWSVDLCFPVDERASRFRDAGVDDAVFPIHADARALPFAREFFDAIVCTDSYLYLGTDDLYLGYLSRLLRPRGQIGMAGAGLVVETDLGRLAHLRAWWEPSLSCLHSAEWWSHHWTRSGIVDVERADTLADGWRLWMRWQRAVAPDNAPEIVALEADRGRHLGYVRTVGRRRADVAADDPISSIPVAYDRQPLLVGQD